MFAEVLADHSIDGAFDKTGGDPFAAAAALRIVRDHVLVVGDVCLKLGSPFSQCFDTGVVCFDIIQTYDQIFDCAMAGVQVPIPHKPFDLAKQPCQLLGIPLVMVGQAFDVLLNDRQAHGDMEPVQDMFRDRSYA